MHARPFAQGVIAITNETSDTGKRDLG